MNYCVMHSIVYTDKYTDRQICDKATAAFGILTFTRLLCHCVKCPYEMIDIQQFEQVPERWYVSFEFSPATLKITLITGMINI